MMPKRIAETDPGTQISEIVGSGPFIFKNDEWKPGEKIVYVRNPDYKPRAEPPSGLAGGKVAKVDRVEWLAIPDHMTAVNALLAGEIDYIEAPPHDLLPLLQGRPERHRQGLQHRSARSTCSAGTRLQPPFDNPKIRRAAMYRLQPEGLPRRRRSAIRTTTASARRCSSAARRWRPMPAWTACCESNFAKSKALLKEAGYDGTPVVMLHTTDIAVLTNAGPIAKVAARKGRLQGRDGAARLPGDRLAPPAQDRTDRWRLERLHDGLAIDRHDESAHQHHGQRVMRQGRLRLAVRCRGREAARRLCPRARPVGAAEGSQPSFKRARSRSARTSSLANIRCPPPHAASAGS